jgi:hypothetical protein
MKTILDPTTIIYRALLPFRRMEHFAAHGITPFAHFTIAIAGTAIRATATDQIIHVIRLL